MIKTRAKFNLTVTKNEDGSMGVSGGVVTDGCEENKAFADATPCGSFSISISKDKLAQHVFAKGSGEYYLFIEPCEAKVIEAPEAKVFEAPPGSGV